MKIEIKRESWKIIKVQKGKTKQRKKKRLKREKKKERDYAWNFKKIFKNKYK